MLLNEIKSVQCGVRLCLPRRKGRRCAQLRFIRALPNKVLFPLRLNPGEQMRLIFSRPGYEINQEGVKSVAVQFVYPSKGLLHGQYTGPELLLGLDPFNLALRGGLTVGYWVAFGAQPDQQVI